MADRLVHIVDDAEVLADAGDLTLVVVLTGFLDAGKSAELAARHLSDLAEGKVVATFDVDALHDYRARRPPVTTTPTTRRPGWSSARCATPAVRRSCCSPAPSPTSGGRPSPAPSARSSSAST